MEVREFSLDRLVGAIGQLRTPGEAGAEAEQTAAAGVFEGGNSTGNLPVPCTRPIRRFYLTPPAVPTFIISALLAVVAVLAAYGHIPQLHTIGSFTVLLIAYVILLAGTLLRGV